MSPAGRKARHVAKALRERLSEAGLSMREVDRRLAWGEDRLARLLRGKNGLKVADLLAVLQVAGIEERSFFAELYDLEPRRQARIRDEVPYSIGTLSEGDDPSFPQAEEVITLVRTLVQDGVRRRERSPHQVPEIVPLDEADLPRGPKRGKRRNS